MKFVSNPPPPPPDSPPFLEINENFESIFACEAMEINNFVLAQINLKEVEKNKFFLLLYLGRTIKTLLEIFFLMKYYNL